MPMTYDRYSFPALTRYEKIPYFGSIRLRPAGPRRSTRRNNKSCSGHTPMTGTRIDVIDVVVVVVIRARSRRRHLGGGY